MGKQSGKRLLLIGFIVVLLLAIPLTLYVLRIRSNVQSHAQASTKLSFTPTSSQTAPLTTNVGATIPLQVFVDPGVNLVSFVKLEIKYDPTKLQASGSGAFVPNSAAFPTVLEGPVYSSGQISVTLSIGADPTKAIQAPVSAGTINFTALAATDPNSPAQITYLTTSSSDTQVLSTGPTDQASENVLSTTAPAFITINGAAGPTNTPTPTVTPVPGQPTNTPTLTPTLTPTVTPVPGVPTPTNTPIPTAVPTPVTITVVASPTPGTVVVVVQPTAAPPTATIAATGSTDVAFGAGAILTALTVIGAILFFVI